MRALVPLFFTAAFFWACVRGPAGAWLAWFALHLVYLLGGRNRVSTLINLTYRYISWGRGGAVIVGDEPVNARQRPVASKNLFLQTVVVRGAKPRCPQ